MNLRRKRLVERFKSPSASSSSSVFSRATSFCDSVAVRRETSRPWRPAQWIVRSRPFLSPLPEFIHAVFDFADAIGDLCFRKRELRKRGSAQAETARIAPTRIF